MTALMCRLCTQSPAIKSSHTIPAFVFRQIKSASPSGFLRRPKEPNRRLQDGDSMPLLCESCEQRFSIRESQFAQTMAPFYDADHMTFHYGEWMHYFLTSLAWRTLILDLPGISEDPTVPRKVVESLSQAKDQWADYLLGNDRIAHSIRNHVLLFVKAENCTPDIAAMNINVRIRCSAFGYTLYDKSVGCASVVHNLAGVICVLHVKGRPQDVWEGTKISPSGGVLEPPRNVDSWVIGDVIDLLRGVNATPISERQMALIVAKCRQRPDAPALRFHRADQLLRKQQKSDC